MRSLAFRVLGLLLVGCVFFGSEAKASWLSEGPLLTISGQEYTKQDFRDWWEHWNNKGELDLAGSLDDFIDFKIMAQQSLAMEYDKHPSYLRKTGVFLKVRSLLLLQSEEIKSKIKITEENIRENFNERFAPIWDVQILTFKDQGDSEDAYERMKPFVGKAAGQLIFADLQGIGESVYEEARVSPEAVVKAKRSEWLKIIRLLEEGQVSKPQAVGDNGQFVIFRINGVSQPEEDLYEKKKDRIKHELYKKRRGELTQKLLEKLKNKLHLSIDEGLFRDIDIGKEYPEDFLSRTLVSMDGLRVSVGQFLMNTKKDSRRRPGATDEFIKNNILYGIINQGLIDTEALNRHYERREPLKKTWEFYTQNRLRITMEEVIRANILVGDEEVSGYYENNPEQFSVPAKFTYVLIRGETDLINKIWGGQLQGQEVTASAKKHGVDAELSISSEDKMDEGLRKIIHAMDKGETSSPFKYKEGVAIVKVIGKISAEKQAFESVRAEIKNKIIDSRFKQQKKDYLEELRRRSDIIVNNQVWKEIKDKK